MLRVGTEKTDWTTKTSIKLDVPLFYIVKRGLSESQIETIKAALSLTPCQAVVISDFSDEPQAVHLAPVVLSANSDSLAVELARDWAEKTGRPLLVIGKSELLDAVYSDGHQEPVFDA